MNLEDKTRKVWEESGRNNGAVYRYLSSEEVSAEEYGKYVEDWPSGTYEGTLAASFICKWLREEDEKIMKTGETMATKQREFIAREDSPISIPPVPTWTDEEIAEDIAQTNAANPCSIFVDRESGKDIVFDSGYGKGIILKQADGEIVSETVDLYEELFTVDDPDPILSYDAQKTKDQMLEVAIGIVEASEKIEAEPKHKGLRYNTGKLRYDLVHPWAHEQMVKVLTKGAEKYAERNWEKGMAWSNVLASLERHLQAIKKGEDYDPETGELHAAHLACNAHFLTAYYKIYPQGDDRPHRYLSPQKIGLDIDDVLADFVGKWRERYPNNEVNFWNFDKDMKEKFAEVAQDKDFWMTMKPKIKPEDLPFEPTCYITSRMIPNEWTEEWLQVNGFPAVPVHTIGFNESKVEVAKESGIEIFVDDRYENFVELNNAGIATFLMDAKHNQRYDVGFKRIYSLKDLA